MTRSYCLTVEVQSENIRNGLGYMIGFRLPSQHLTPAQMTEFSEWSEKVKEAVLRAGDQPFHADPYTKKVAIAELMHTLSDLNDRYSIKVIGSDDYSDMHAVQIRSTNPFDSHITIGFTDREGHFRVTERSLADLERARVEHGRTSIVDATRHDFPFEMEPPGRPFNGPAARKPRANTPRP